MNINWNFASHWKWDSCVCETEDYEHDFYDRRAYWKYWKHIDYLTEKGWCQNAF